MRTAAAPAPPRRGRLRPRSRVDPPAPPSLSSSSPPPPPPTPVGEAAYRRPPSSSDSPSDGGGSAAAAAAAAPPRSGSGGAPGAGAGGADRRHTVLERALDLAGVGEIDVLLSKRIPAPMCCEVVPPPSPTGGRRGEESRSSSRRRQQQQQQQPPAALPPGGDDDSSSEDGSAATTASAPTTAAAATANRPSRSRSRSRRRPAAAPRLTLEEEYRAVSDVYGRSPPPVALRESRLAALEREIARLPPGSGRALGRALRHHPLLTVAGPHARRLLQNEEGGEGGGGGFDAAEAARRLAKYWERREAMFGKRAYDEGVFTDPTFDDYLRFYDRCRVAGEGGADGDNGGGNGSDDEEMDRDMRDIAAEYVRCVHRAKIGALDRLIEQSPDRDKAAYVEATRVCPDLACSDEHKVLFLRSEDMVETKAAVRLMKYWAAKKLLFGPDMLGKEILLGDVTDGVFDAEVEGFFRLMPGTDGSGRSVLLVFANELEKKGWTKEALAQYLWCVMHIALSRPSCLRHGLVFMVDYRSGTTELYHSLSPLRRLFRTLLFECVPVKVRVTHWFFDPDAVGWWRGLMLSVFSNVSSVVRKRTVVHMGRTDEENMRVLEGEFGIGPGQVPTELGGDETLEEWRGWIRDRRERGL